MHNVGKIFCCKSFSNRPSCCFSVLPISNYPIINIFIACNTRLFLGGFCQILAKMGNALLISSFLQFAIKKEHFILSDENNCHHPAKSQKFCSKFSKEAGTKFL